MKDKIIEILKEVATHAITSELNPDELDAEGFEIFATRIDSLDFGTMSESLFRKVKCSKRLPKAGIRVGVLLQQPEIKFSNGAIPVKEQLFHSSGWVNGKKEWIISSEADQDYEVFYWLEELSHPTPEISEGEIEDMVDNEIPFDDDEAIADEYNRYFFKRGIEAAIKKWVTKGAKPVSEKFHYQKEHHIKNAIQSVLSEYMGPSKNDRVTTKILTSIKELNNE
jgi:hypothetical protein